MVGHTRASMKPGNICLLAVCFCVFVRGSESSMVAAFEGSDNHPQKMYSRGNLKYIATRLHPGDELKSCLGELCSGRSMFVLSCVGSVSCATIRCANYLKSGSSTTNDIKVLKQKFEIVSLVGSICDDGMHLHISLADKDGHVLGGHLMNATIFTTAEILLGELESTKLSRIHDQRTGYPELVVPKDQESAENEGTALERLFKYLHGGLLRLKGGDGDARGKGLCSKVPLSKSLLYLSSCYVANRRESNVLPRTDRINSRAVYKLSSQDENKVRQSYLYEDVKKVLNGYHGKRGSLKSLSLKPDIRRKAATLSLSSKTLLYGESVIDGLLNSLNLASPVQDNGFKDPTIRNSLPSDDSLYRRIVTTDLLFGSGKLSKSGHDPVLHEVMRSLRRNQSQIHQKFQEYLQLSGHKSVAEFVSSKSQNSSAVRNHPRFLRINLLKATRESVARSLEDEGFTRVNHVSVGPLGMQDKKRCFSEDEIIPDILTIWNKVDLHNHHLVTSGLVLQQDKASTFPVHALIGTGTLHSERKFNFVIDACAAPGNKASHLAAVALQPDKGVLVAIEKSPEREKLLRETLRRMGCTSVRVYRRDWLQVSHDDELLSQADAIVVDPSCSNSGVLRDAMDASPSRLRGLSDFQRKALIHALSFPSVKFVVYSTCSVHREEDEEVVESALNAVGDRFHLEHVLPQWKRRGIPSASFPSALSECCIRADPDKDLMHGFFVACFARKT